MDATIASLQSWELLAQLAAYGRVEAVELDTATLLKRIAELFQRSLPSPWGMISAADSGCVRTATWGLAQEEQHGLNSNGHGAADTDYHAVRFPLESGTETRGYLLLAQPLDGSATLDPSFGSALAGQVALLLDLHRRYLTERLARALQQLARAAGAQPTLEDLLALTLEQLANVLPYDQASLLLFEDDSGRGSTFAAPGSPLRLAATRTVNPSHQLLLPPPTAPLYTNAIVARRPQLLTATDSATEAIMVPAEEAGGRLLLVPLLIAEEPIGLLAILSAPERLYGSDERDAAAALADQAAQTIAATRRFAQQHQRARELFVLFENSQVISTTTQLDALLDRALENIALAMRADSCAVALIDLDDTDRLEVVSFYGTEVAFDPLGHSYMLSESPALRLLLAEEGAQAVEHVLEQSEQLDAPAGEILYTLGYNSGILVPLRAKERAIGVLGVGYIGNDHSFTRSDLNLIETLTNQVAAAVANAQLAAAEHRRATELELLQSISQQLSADLLIEETTEALSEGVRKLVPHSSLEICLYDAEQQIFHALRNEGPDTPITRRTFLPDEGLTGWLARHRRSLRLTDVTRRSPVTQVEATLADGQPVRGYLGLPLQVGDELVGTLELASNRLGAFSERDERLLTIVASQAAQALRNALRYEQADEHLRTRIKQLTALQHVNSQLTMGHFLPDILSFVLEQARKATTASRGFIALYNTKPSAEWQQRAPGYFVIAADGYDAHTHARLVDYPLNEQATTAQSALTRGELELIDELSEEERTATFSPDARSALAVPIFYEAQVVGVLTLLSPLLHGFDHDAKEFVLALANQSALAIGNAQRYEDQVRLNMQLQRRATILNNVLEIGHALRADRPIDEVLEQVGYSVIEASGFRRVLFHLVDPDDPETLRVVTGAGIPLSELERLRQGRFPMELALRYLDPRFRIGRSFFITREQADEVSGGFDITSFMSYPDIDPRSPDQWQRDDMLFVPLYTPYGRGLIGMLSVDDPTDGERPTVRTVEPLAIFADQAAIAIENVHLVRSARDQAEQMTALFQVGAAVASTLDLDTLLDRVYDQLIAYLDTPTLFFVASYDAGHELITFQSFRIQGEEKGEKWSMPKGGTTGWLIDQGQPLLMRDTHLEGEPPAISEISIPNLPDTRSRVFVPLRSQNRVIGVLSVQHFDPNRYSERDVTFLSALGNTLAVALENVDLFQERERRIAELDVINRIGNITSSTLNLQQMLGQVYDCLADFLTVDAFYALMYRSDSNEIVLAFTVDEGIQQTFSLAEPPDTESLSAQIIRTRQPLLFRNLQGEEFGNGRAPIRFGNTERTSASWLGVPLLVGEGEVVGVISVQGYTPDLYGERELSFLSTVASQLALGVQNARLFVDRERRIAELDVINRIGNITNSTLNLVQMLGQVYDCLVDFLAIDSCYIYIYHIEDNTISLSFEVDEGVRVVKTETRRPSTGSLSERIIQTRQPLLFRDLHQEREQLGLQPHPFGNTARKTASWLGVPLLAGEGTVVGVIAVQNYAPGLYGERELSFLSTVASELALGVQNARLFEERDRQIVELDALGRVGRVTSSALELLPITQGLHEVLGDVLGADVVSLTVYQPKRDVARVVVVDHGGVLLNSEQSLNAIATESTLADRVVRSGMPLTIDDLQSIWSELPGLQRLFPEQQPHPRSYQGVPLLAFDGTPMGALGVFAWQPRSFGGRERSFLASVVAQVSLGVQNVLLYTQSQGQVQQLGLLNRVSSVAASTMEREQIYQAAVDAMAQATEADRAELIMYDRPTGTATIVAEHANGLPSKRLVFSLLQNPAVDWMDANQRPLIAPDAQNDPLLVLTHGLHRSMDLRSLAFIPLIIGGDVIGVVSLDAIGRSMSFSEQQIELCQTIANQTATAIENVRLFHEAQGNASAFQRKVDELSTLLDAARLLSSSLRPDEVLDYLMDLVGRQLDVNTVALWTIGSNGQLTPAAMDGIPSDTARTMQVPVGMGMTGQVASTSQPLIVPDVEAQGQSLYPEFNRRNQLSSFMGVPVIYRERTVGVLSVMTIERREFTADEMLLLVGLADQAAIALENARLFQQRERRIIELMTLNHISEEVNATLELQPLLRALQAGIDEVIENSTSFIGLYDALQERMTFLITRVAGEDYTDTEPLILNNPDTLIARVVLETRPLLLNTPQEIAALGLSLPERGLPLIASYLGVPIAIGDDVLGAIILQSDEPYAFDSDDERFLVTVASQAATAIAKAHLFDEREQRLKEVTALKDIGSALSSTLDVQQMLEQLHRELGRVIDVDTALIGLYDPEQDTLSFPVMYDQGQRVYALPLPLDDGPSAWAIRNQAPLLIETLELGEQMGFDLRDNSNREGPPDHFEESFLVVPIVSSNGVLGVINIQSYQPYAFDADDLRFVTTAANQAAVTIANARLFSERERRIQELATFNEIGQALSATVSFEELTDLIYRQTSRLLDTTNFYMALLDERSGAVSFPLYIERGERKDVLPVRDGTSLTEYVMHAREHLLLQGGNMEQQVAALGIAPEGNVARSWLGVPMISADKVIGMIGIQDYERDAAYREDDVRLLSTITSWAGIALANARLIGAQQQSLDELTNLYQVSVDLAGTLETREVQRIVASAALRLLNVDLCAIMTLDSQPDGGHARMMQQVLVDRSGVRPDLSIPVRLDGLTAQVLDSERPMLVSDLRQKHDPNHAALELGVRGVLGIAIGSQDQRLGVLWVGNTQPYDWNEREISLLSILANLAGQALQSAELFQSELTRRRLADTLRDVAQSFTSTLALDEIQTLILDQLANVVPFDTAVVLLREEGTLYASATRGYVEHDPEHPWVFNIEGTPIFERMSEDRQPILIADVQQDPLGVEVARSFAAHGEAPLVRCWIGAPLLVDGELVGVLTVGSVTTSAYSADDAQVAFALASQASQAIQNARLFEQISSIAAELERANSELEQRVAERTADLEAEKERLEAVHAITLELTSTLDMDEILGKALKMACNTVGAARGSIMLKDAQTGELVCRQVMTDEGEARPEHLPIGFGSASGGLAGWVLEHEEAVRIPDVRRDRRWVIEAGRADEVRSVAAVPLMSNEVPLGVLVLNSPHVGFFTEPQLRLLATIANEVAIAVHNGELYTLINDFASRMGEALEREREEFSKTRAILQSVTEGVIVLDEDRRVVLFNPAAEQVLDMSARAMRDRPLEHLTEQGATESGRRRAQLIYDGLYTGLEAAKDRQGIYSTKLELPEPTQTIAVNLAPVIGNDGRMYGDVAVLRDVTREIEADRAKREFISGVSHELRTPLTSIKGYVDLLLSGLLGPLSDTQLNSLSVVKTNSNRLMDLINDILTISSIEAGKIELNLSKVQIANIINDVVQSLLLETQRKSLRVTVSVPDDLPTVMADKKRLTQVVFNLFSNAVKYTYENGSIFVRAFLNPAGLMQMEVEDTGVGMTAEQKEKLFRPFYRADNPLREEAGGTGLGLSIAKSLVEQHGGELWPTSELGKGSIFHFVIPVQQADATNADRDSE